MCKRQGCIHSTNTTNPNRLAVRLQKIQFPVCLVFAMSINKAQGQSLKIVGIHLQNPCFSHGHIYVTCSRVGHPTNLHILAPGGKTRNIVHPTALQWHFSQNIKNAFPLFLEQCIPFTDDAVPPNGHMSVLSRNPGAFHRQHGVYFTVTHFHNFCSPFSVYQKITPSIGFHDWSSRAPPGTPASLLIKQMSVRAPVQWWVLMYISQLSGNPSVTVITHFTSTNTPQPLSWHIYFLI